MSFLVNTTATNTATATSATATHQRTSDAHASELSLEEALAFFDGYDEHGDLSGGAYATNTSTQQNAAAVVSDAMVMDDAADQAFMVGGDAMFLNPDFQIDLMTASMLQPMHIGAHENADAEAPWPTPMQTLLASELPVLETTSTTATVDFAVPAAKGKKNGAKKGKSVTTKAKSAAFVVPPPTKAQKTATATTAASSGTGSNSTSTKRVRRQKEELLYLRTKVVELEERLQQLKRVNGETSSSKGSPVNANDADGSASPTTTAPSTSSDHSPISAKHRDEETEEEDAAPAISPALLASVWENVADRQYKERLRAEQQNKKLKTMLEGQIKLATSLEKILKKRPNMEVLYPDTESKPPKSQRVITYEETDAEIFKKQLEGVEKAYLEVDEVMEATGFFTSEETRHDFRVRDFPDDNGVLMEFMATTAVPFDLHVTGNALWRFMSDVSIKRHCYFEQQGEFTDDTVSRSFGVSLYEADQKVDMRGKHTLRKFIEDDRVVVVWKSLMEPIKLATSNIQGLRFHDIGWIVAQRSETNPIGSTLIKAYGHLSPFIPEDIEDQDEQIGALTDFVINCHESNTALCMQLINDLLVEEEWKTTIPVIL